MRRKTGNNSGSFFIHVLLPLYPSSRSLSSCNRREQRKYNEIAPIKLVSEPSDNRKMAKKAVIVHFSSIQTFGHLQESSFFNHRPLVGVRDLMPPPPLPGFPSHGDRSTLY